MEDSLYLACERGDLEMVKYLIEMRGADINATASRYYVRFNQVATQRSGSLGATPLFIASLRKHTEIVKYLVERGANVTAGLSYSSNLKAGLTPLHAAFYHFECWYVPRWVENVTQEQLEVIRCIVEAGADPSAGLPNGTIPIWMMGGVTFYTNEFCHLSSLKNTNFRCNPRVVRLLVELGMSITQLCPYGRNLLHYLASSVLEDNSEVFEFLMEKGANLNGRDNEGITPIMAAAIGNNKVPNIPILKLLLERKDVTNMDKINALEVAAAVLLDYVSRLTLIFPGNIVEYANRHEEMVGFLILAKTIRLLERLPLKEKNGWSVESFTNFDIFQQLQRPSSEYELQSILIRLEVFSSISWGAFRRYSWPYIAQLHDCLTRGLTGQEQKIEKTLDVCQKVLKIIHRQDNEEEGLYAIKIGVVSMVQSALTELAHSNSPLSSTEILETTLDLLKPTYQAFPPPDEENRLNRDYFLKFYNLILMLDNLPGALRTPKVKDFVRHIVGLNGRDSDGRSFLYLAIRSEPSSKVFYVIDLLLQNGIDADSVDHAGNGALHYLAKKKRNCFQREAAARLLLDHGAHFDRTNNEGKTAADIWPETMEADWRDWFIDYVDVINAHRPEWLNEGVPQLKCLAARVARRLDLHNRVLNKDGLPLLPNSLVRFVGMH